MRRLLKLKVLTMIALLNCSTSWCQSNDVDTLSSTGVLDSNDSTVTVPISVIKQANVKLIELKYEKEINSELRNIILNDSVIIKGLKQNEEFYKALATNREKELKKVKVQRKLLSYFGIVASVVAIVFAVK